MSSWLICSDRIHNDSNHTDDVGDNEDDQRVLGKVDAVSTLRKPEIHLVAKPA